MKAIYEQIWQLARPYYEKGRPMDIDHIEWMMDVAEQVCIKENLDDSLLMPLVILHDVGYAEIAADNPFQQDVRRAHMETGAGIAKDILEKLEYPKAKSDQIVFYISVHDNWAVGDDEIYHQDRLLGIFNDLDYIWMATPKGFTALMKILRKDHHEMMAYLGNNEKLIRRPFASLTTQKLYKDYIANLQIQ